jgi:hypothetical protein
VISKEEKTERVVYNALLLLDGVGVGGTLGGVDELVGNCSESKHTRGTEPQRVGTPQGPREVSEIWEGNGKGRGRGMMSKRNLVDIAHSRGNCHSGRWTESDLRHSEMLLTLRKDDSRTPMVMSETAWLTRRRGETSTAWRRTVPWEPIRVESSRGPVLTIASTRTWTGFWSVRRLTISKAWATMRTA